MYEHVCEILRGMPELTENEAGDFIFEIYTDVGDEVDSHTVAEWCQKSNPTSAVKSEIESLYEDYIIQTMGKIFGTVRAQLPENEMNDNSLNDSLHELVQFEFPIEHFLKQKVPVNIIVDTGDGDYDFSLNSRYPAWGGEKESKISPKAGIRWFAETQGYAEPELRAALAKGDLFDPHGFLETLRVELANDTSGGAPVVFLAEMSVSDLLELNTRCHNKCTLANNTVIISKHAVCGLYDPWNGGGLLEVGLERDLVLPLAFILSALPDEGEGVGIEHYYGVCRSAWRSGVVRFPTVTLD